MRLVCVHEVEVCPIPPRLNHSDFYVFHALQSVRIAQFRGDFYSALSASLRAFGQRGIWLRLAALRSMRSFAAIPIGAFWSNAASHLTTSHLATIVFIAMRAGQKWRQKKRFAWANAPVCRPSPSCAKGSFSPSLSRLLQPGIHHFQSNYSHSHPFSTKSLQVPFSEKFTPKNRFPGSKPIKPIQTYSNPVALFLGLQLSPTTKFAHTPQLQHFSFQPLAFSP